MIALLKIHKALLKVRERGKIVGSEYFSLDDGEVDLNLIDPTGMNRGMDQKGVGPASSDAIDGFLPAMRRAVIHDPEDTLGGSIGFAAHDRGDETIGGRNTTLLFTMSKELGTMDIPSCQISPSTLPEILVLNPHGAASSNWQGGLLAAARLNTGFFIRAEDELRALQGFALPNSSVEIEDAPSFASKVRIAGKDPTTVLPRSKGVGTEPTPECRAADLGNNTLSYYLLADIGQGQARERQPETMRQLTSESFYLHDDAGGKRELDAHPEVVPRGPVDGLKQIACAICSQSGGACPGVRQ